MSLINKMKTDEGISIIVIIVIIIIVAFICIFFIFNRKKCCQKNQNNYTACPHGLTINKEKCNQSCASTYGNKTIYTIYGVCCPKGVTNKKRYCLKTTGNICGSKLLSGNDVNPYGLSITNGNDPNICCYSGITNRGNGNCNKRCNNPKSKNIKASSLHTNFGQCCEYGFIKVPNGTGPNGTKFTRQECNYCGVQDICVQWTEIYRTDIGGNYTDRASYRTSPQKNVMFKAPGNTFNFVKSSQGTGTPIHTIDNKTGFPIGGPATCSMTNHYYPNYCNGNQEFMKYRLSTVKTKYPIDIINGPASGNTANSTNAL